MKPLFLPFKLLLLLMCLSAVAMAATKTWTGAGGTSSWNFAPNWAGGIPTAADDAVIAPAAFQPTVTTMVTVNNLTIQAGAVLGNNATIVINGTFNPFGTLTPGAGVVTLANAQVVPSAGYTTLNLTGSGTYSLASAVTVSRNLAIGSNTVVDCGAFDLTVVGNVEIPGTIGNPNGGNGSLVMAGVNQFLNAADGSGSINRLVVNASMQVSSNVTDLTITELLRVHNAPFMISMSRKLTISPTCALDFTGNGVLTCSFPGTIDIQGNNASPIIANFKATTMGNLTVNRIGGITLGANMVVRGHLNILQSSVKMNGFNLTIGSVTSATGYVSTQSGTMITNTDAVGNVKNTGTFILNGMNNSPVNLPLLFGDMQNISINTPVGAIIGQPFTLNGTFRCTKGVIDLGNTLTPMVNIGVNGSVMESLNGYFKGLGILSYTQPYPANTTTISNVNPAGLGLMITITAITASNPMTLSVQRSGLDFGNGGYIKRAYTFQLQGATAATVTRVRTKFLNSELNGNLDSTLKMFSRIAPASNPSIENLSSVTVSSMSIGLMRNINVGGNAIHFYAKSATTPRLAQASNLPNAIQLKVYPNPATAVLNVTIEGQNSPYHIAFTNLYGQVVYQKSFTQTTAQIPVSEFSQGLYFITISNENGLISTQKWVKE